MFNHNSNADYPPDNQFSRSETPTLSTSESLELLPIYNLFSSQQFHEIDHIGVVCRCCCGQVSDLKRNDPTYGDCLLAALRYGTFGSTILLSTMNTSRMLPSVRTSHWRSVCGF